MAEQPANPTRHKEYALPVATATTAALLPGVPGSMPLLLAVNGAPAGAVAPAATITVDGATCTLADAITAANTNTATGGCDTGSAGADTLNLTANIGLTAALPAR